ncbi:MAG: hypothetical protein PVJ61_03555 [Dehalococcoidia bacterium]|jgi:hypothetical protein
MYWVIFAIGAALGIFGLIRVFRYLVWMRLVWLSDGAREAIDSAIKDFEAGPVVVEKSGKKRKLDERAVKLQKGMERRMERFRGVARWLWPQRTGSVSSWVTLSLEAAIACIDENVKKASRKKPQLAEFRDTMTRLMLEYEDLTQHLRDTANREVVWATASFALGALTISLYTLWLQFH